MSAKSTDLGFDPEIVAISTVFNALKVLEPEAQRRVVNFVLQKLNVKDVFADTPNLVSTYANTNDPPVDDSPQAVSHASSRDDGLEGISPIAQRWMIRNGLGSDKLSLLFSLGVEEIDLVAKSAPGKNKKERMRSVLLLKGVAAYLSSGTPRFTHEQLKEACVHYDAFDSSNFASYLKTMQAEVGGTKDGGYTLTTRGLTSATEMVKELVGESSNR